MAIEALLGVEWALNMLGGGGNPSAWYAVDGDRGRFDGRTRGRPTAHHVGMGNEYIGVELESRPQPRGGSVVVLDRDHLGLGERLRGQPPGRLPAVGLAAPPGPRRDRSLRAGNPGADVPRPRRGGGPVGSAASAGRSASDESRGAPRQPGRPGRERVCHGWHERPAGLVHRLGGAALVPWGATSDRPRSPEDTLGARIGPRGRRPCRGRHSGEGRDRRGVSGSARRVLVPPGETRAKGTRCASGGTGPPRRAPARRGVRHVRRRERCRRPPGVGAASNAVQRRSSPAVAHPPGYQRV